MKKKITIISIIVATLVLAVLVAHFYKDTGNKLKDLPKPEISGGTRGELGIDKNINEKTIDEYLNRPDAVYRDMRMLEDPGNYEAIGGDRFLSGYIKGFEVIPLPYIIPVTGLPNEVGETYTGTTLFYYDNGTYIANYEESIEIIEKIFPKDKVIFLMCGGGGYAGMTKNFLISLGWDENKIYNVGGYWYYKGKNNITVKKEVDGVVSYDFEKVPYHDIQFDELTKSSNYRESNIKVKELKISTNHIELEEGSSFKLNVIVLPNEAANKKIIWSSSNSDVATITDEGLVKGVKSGKTTITATSVDGNKKVTCDVIVNKKEIRELIKLDDIREESSELAMYDINKINQEFYTLTTNSDGSTKEEYLESDGRVNYLWKEEYNKSQEKINEALKKRLEIFNKVIDAKKSFIVVIEDTDCESNYSVSEAAKEILDQKGYNYFLVSTIAGAGNGDTTFFESKLDVSDYNGGAIAIIKKGKLYVSSSPETTAFNNKEDIINWLSKYIEIK